jgi:hypothetical protein
VLPRVLLLSFLLSSCFAVETSRTYDKAMTTGRCSSEPIYLSFTDNRDGSFYLVLDKNITSEKYVLSVRWISRAQERQFNGMDSSLKFMINRSELIDLLPASMPKILSYNIEDNSIEEEAIYNLRREQLEAIAKAKHVLVELTGKHNKVIVGRFNKFHTVRAFKDFLKNC